MATEFAVLTDQDCTPCPPKEQCLPPAGNLQTRRAPSSAWDPGFGCTDETRATTMPKRRQTTAHVILLPLRAAPWRPANHNPDATVDDGSCVMPDPVDGCTDTCDFPVSVSEAALAQTAARTAVEFGAYGTLSSLEVTLDWSRAEGTGAWRPTCWSRKLACRMAAVWPWVDTPMTSATCTDLGNYAAVLARCLGDQHGRHIHHVH